MTLPGLIWLNGRLLPADAAYIRPDDRGVTLGDGLFETLAVLDGVPLRLARHFARLHRGADLLGIPLPLTDTELRGAIGELLVANAISRASLRLTLTRGPAPRGLLPPERPTPTLMLAAGPLPPPVGAPAAAITATVTRRNAASPLSGIKHLNQLDNILARQEAAARGADEAILLNGMGRIAEASIANLFVVLQGRLLTPPVAEGALPGVRRAELLESGHAAEALLSIEDLFAAEEIFLTNSLSLRPVISIDGRPVGGGAPGPVFRALTGN